MAVLPFDELNKPDGRTTKKSSRKSVPYKDYFSAMGLKAKEKELRISIATDIEDAVLFLYALKAEGASPSLASNEFMAELLYRVGEYGEIDDYVEEITQKYADDLSKTDVPEEEKDNAMFLAEDMANAYANYIEYQDAVKTGKTKKAWITENDNLVRPTHQELENKAIGIDELFSVGGYDMRFPKDTAYGASNEEIIRCRCSIKYF